MPEFILNLITARGWSIRHLAELTDLSYSGIRDYLKGMPQRLSQERLQRVFLILGLDQDGKLQDNILYTWSVDARDTERLLALSYVLKIGCQQLKNNTTQDAFEATPLLAGSNIELPAPFWILRLAETYIIIKWELKQTKRIAKVPDFYTQDETNQEKKPNLFPDINQLDAVKLADGMSFSVDNMCAIHLSPSQYSLLEASIGQDKTLSLGTIKTWLDSEPIDDFFWSVPDTNNQNFSWEDIIEHLKGRYSSPAATAIALGINKRY